MSFMGGARRFTAAATVAAILCRGARAQSPLGPSLPKLRPVELRPVGHWARERLKDKTDLAWAHLGVLALQHNTT